MRADCARACACLEVRILRSAVSGIARFFPLHALYPCAGLHLPQCPHICAGVSRAARSLCFRSQHRAPALPPHARNCQQALPPNSCSCPAAPRAQSPLQRLPQRPRICAGVSCAASLVVPCVLTARVFALAAVSAHLRRRFRGCVFLVLPSQHRMPAFSPRARNRRQARAHAPPPHVRNRQQALPPNPRLCFSTPRSQSPSPQRLPLLALCTVCRLMLAAVSAHLCRRFRGCVFPTLPFPASHASASAPRT